MQRAVKALFPRWTNSVVPAALLATGATVAGVPALTMAWVRTPWVTRVGVPVDQPVEFDHRHHVRDDGIQCEYCHATAERSPYAGIPSTDVCMGCHSQIWDDSPLLEPVAASAWSGRPIEWQRVAILPDFVYFRHDGHLAAGVPCESCHGAVDEMPKVWAATSFAMGWCLDCHREHRGAPTDCDGCHR
jgi:hypothetical protein